MRKTPTASNPFVGRWRITHMDQWEQDFVDAEVEGYVEFAVNGSCVASSSFPYPR